MGSFYTTCSVSHMVLTNQKTSIQLLVPNYSTDFKEHLGMIVSNDGAQGFFAVFGFPIHGRYYDYCKVQIFFGNSETIRLFIFKNNIIHGKY